MVSLSLDPALRGYRGQNSDQNEGAAERHDQHFVELLILPLFERSTRKTATTLLPVAYGGKQHRGRRQCFNSSAVLTAYRA